MRLVKLSHQSEEPIHIVCLDGGLPYNTVAIWGKWMRVQNTFFHFHIWSDVMIRQREFMETLVQLAGFNGAIHVCSHSMQLLMERWLGSASYHQHMIPLNSEHFKNTHLKSPSKKKQLTYFGRINIDKGLDYLVRWFQLNNDKCQLKLYGKPSYEQELSWRPGTFRSRQIRLENDLKKNGIKYKFLNSRLKIVKALNESWLVVSCSTFIYEEFGLAVAEAIAAGRPVLISNWGGHKAFSSAEGVFYISVKTKLFPHVCIKSLDENLEKLLNSSEVKLKGYGRTNRQWAKKNLTIEIIGRKIGISLVHTSLLPYPIKHPTFTKEDVSYAFTRN